MKEERQKGRKRGLEGENEEEGRRQEGRRGKTEEGGEAKINTVTSRWAILASESPSKSIQLGHWVPGQTLSCFCPIPVCRFGNTGNTTNHSGPPKGFHSLALDPASFKKANGTENSLIAFLPSPVYLVFPKSNIPPVQQRWRSIHIPWSFNEVVKPFGFVSEQVGPTDGFQPACTCVAILDVSAVCFDWLLPMQY